MIDELTKQIIELYSKGNSIAKISKELDIKQSYVYKELKRCEVPMRTKAGREEVPLQKIKNMYLNGISTCKIANELGICVKTVCNALQRLGIERDIRVYDSTLNDNYWKVIDTPEKAYFLGFLAADGNIHDNSVSLQISAKDKEILEVFKKCVNSTRVLTVDSRNLCRFRVRSTQWVKDLKVLGLEACKSKTIQFKELSEELQSHYMRGLVDGDGSISYKGNQIYYAGNCEMVTAFRDYLIRTLEVYPVKVIHAAENVWQVSWSSKRDVRVIGEFLYRNKGVCFIRRKYDNLLELIR